MEVIFHVSFSSKYEYENICRYFIEMEIYKSYTFSLSKSLYATFILFSRTMNIRIFRSERKKVSYNSIVIINCESNLISKKLENRGGETIGTIERKTNRCKAEANREWYFTWGGGREKRLDTRVFHAGSAFRDPLLACTRYARLRLLITVRIEARYAQPSFNLSTDFHLDEYRFGLRAPFHVSWHSQRRPSRKYRCISPIYIRIQFSS